MRRQLQKRMKLPHVQRTVSTQRLYKMNVSPEASVESHMYCMSDCLNSFRLVGGRRASERKGSDISEPHYYGQLFSFYGRCSREGYLT